MTIKAFLVSFLMPEKCYEKIFVNVDLHVPCIIFILKKTSGFWILLDNLLAQLPQLFKILWRRSAVGLSLTSALLQLYAFSCSVLYAKATNFPFFAWGERLFTLVQTAAIVFFILHYRGKTFKGMLFFLLYCTVMSLIASHAAAAVISVMHKSSMVALIASKGFQARTNYCNGHTGQLSALTVTLSWAGSLGVAFVSLQDTGSSFSTMSQVVSACLSCVLVAQIVCYWSRTAIITDKIK